MTEILESLKSSGLFIKIERLYIGIVGTGHVAGLDDERISVLYHDPDLNLMEFETLKHVQRLAIEDRDCLILYLHTKGCSATAEKLAVQTDWRRYMLHFLVKRHAECLAGLTDHDICGVDWRIDPCRCATLRGIFGGHMPATLPHCLPLPELAKPFRAFRHHTSSQCRILGGHEPVM